jgi:hypothetical protein
MNVEMYFEGYLYSGKAGFACRLYIGFVFGFFTIFTDEIKKEKFIRKKHQQLLSKISRIKIISEV